MAKGLTTETINSLKPGRVRREIPDGKLGGLYFVIQPTGARSFAVRFRFDGRPKKFTIGSYPGVSLGAARKRAMEALSDVARGVDPAERKQAARAAARAEKRASIDLVEKVVADFIERHAKPNTRDWEETQRILNKDVVSAWKGRRLSEIGRADVHELLDSIIDRGAPVGANRTFAQLRKMCRWVVARGVIDRNPCEGVTAPSAEKSRDRVLSDDELRILWKVCDADPWPFGRLVQLLVLTGQRRNEVAGMRWGEIDFATKIWTIPASRSKNGRAHAVPVSPQAIAILKGLPRIGDAGGCVFTTNGTTSVSGFSRAKSRLDSTITEMRQDKKPLAPWTLHDIRRSTASGLACLGTQLPVIERLLNHVSGSFGGIVGVYQRHSFADEMRTALDAWARHIDAIVSGKPRGNVVKLRAGA